jgi:serine/threonine protein kinase
MLELLIICLQNKLKRGITKNSDVWSLGCIIYEAAALHPPFMAENYLALAKKIKTGKFDRIPNKYSEDLHRVIKMMLNVNKDKRPSVTDLLKLRNVRVKLKEIRLTEQSTQLKEKIKEIKEREKRLKEKEAKLKIKEEQLNEKAQMIEEREK